MKRIINRLIHLARQQWRWWHRPETIASQPYRIPGGRWESITSDWSPRRGGRWAD